MLRRHSSSMQLLQVALVMIAFLVAGCGGDRDAASRDTATASTATAVRVTDVELGRAIGADNRISDRTDDFRPNDTIYASIVTEGTGANTTLTVRWTFADGQLVDESTRTINATGRDVTEFHISRPSGWPAGQYRLQVMLNGQEVESEEFRVS